MSLTVFVESDYSKKDVLAVLPQLVIVVLLCSLPFVFWYILNKNK